MDLDRNEDLRMIIERVRARDGFAFEALVRRYAERIVRGVHERLEDEGALVGGCSTQVALAEDEVRAALLDSPEVFDEFDFTGEGSLVARLADEAARNLSGR